MSNSRCPIVGRCLRNLDKLVKKRPRDLAEDLQPQKKELEQEYEKISAEPDIVRVRGFVAIEFMLTTMDAVCARGYRADDPLPSFQLLRRSWGGLTATHDLLLKLADDLHLDVTELRIGGAHIVSDWKGTTIMMSHRAGDSDALLQQSGPVVKLKTLCPFVIHAIELLRPFLRNENSPVAPIGDQLTSFVREHYGEFCIETLLNVTRELIEVRL